MPKRIVNQLIRLIFFIFLISCDNNSKLHRGFSKLEQIKYQGTLLVLTRQDPTTYYEGPNGFTGLEYDLITLFAKQLGVRVQFEIPDTFDHLLSQISEGKADIAAAGLTITEQRQLAMRFAPPYQTTTEQVIYRSGHRRPRSVRDLTRGIIEVVKGTSHFDTLAKLKKQYPGLEWYTNTDLDTDGLLFLVNEGLIDFTIADSHQAAIIRSFYPNLNIAFDISKPQKLAWALPLSNDDSLYNEVVAFFNRIKKDHTLSALLEKHYGHVNNLNYVGNCTFRRHIKERLPHYEHFFKAAAEKLDLDWRLLAAIGYQESHWNKRATSPTGVKGLMMLTRGTARQLGIKDRTDPAQSIIGGAIYFKQRLNKIPARIKEPDRTWFALASYNVGFGHLEDARILTQRLKGNPDKWIDVKRNLPLLSQKKWYTQTRHGYARGKEPVRYVENIRSYYNLLAWLTADDQIQKSVMPVISKQPDSPPNAALDINSPVL